MGNIQPSYDGLARYYDFLSRLVFFDAQVKAQTEHLSHIQHCTNLLIVGGGTGWIIKDLNSIVKPIDVTFVETSSKMIELAQKIATHHRIDFVHQDIESFTSSTQFDSVLTPFLFDNFDERKAEKVFKCIDQMLSTDAVWLYTDFRLDGKWWKNILLKTMHLFFRLINAVKVNELPKTQTFFVVNQYLLVSEKLYYGDFIEAKVYKKERYGESKDRLSSY